MASRTNLVLTSLNNGQNSINTSVTIIPHVVGASDVSNGIQCVDFFHNVDASGVIHATNVSPSLGCSFTVVMGAGLEGTSYDGAANTSDGLGNLLVNVPPNSTVELSVIDSSLYGQTITVTDTSEDSPEVFNGLFINVTSTAENILKLAFTAKTPAIYTSPTF